MRWITPFVQTVGVSATSTRPFSFTPPAVLIVNIAPLTVAGRKPLVGLEPPRSG